MRWAFDYFEESTDSFRLLANYPRLLMFGWLADNCENLPEDQARTILDTG